VVSRFSVGVAVAAILADGCNGAETCAPGWGLQLFTQTKQKTSAAQHIAPVNKIPLFLKASLPFMLRTPNGSLAAEKKTSWRHRYCTTCAQKEHNKL